MMLRGKRERRRGGTDGLEICRRFGLGWVFFKEWDVEEWDFFEGVRGGMCDAGGRGSC
jgi:hypothetical protein